MTSANLDKDRPPPAEAKTKLHAVLTDTIVFSSKFLSARSTCTPPSDCTSCEKLTAGSSLTLERRAREQRDVVSVIEPPPEVRKPRGTITVVPFLKIVRITSKSRSRISSFCHPYRTSITRGSEYEPVPIAEGEYTTGARSASGHVMLCALT